MVYDPNGHRRDMLYKLYKKRKELNQDKKSLVSRLAKFFKKVDPDYKEAQTAYQKARQRNKNNS